jgi:heptosyltransferase III
MNDPIRKRLELWFRRHLIRFLKGVIQRQKILSNTIDFNSCKFLFIRLDRIGDVLISTPLFAILKKHYPGATIDVLLSKNNYFVLENDPLIHKRWLYKKKLGNIISFIADLRKERFDFVIDLMDNPSATSTIFCLLIHARWNVGIKKDNSFVYDITVPMLSRRDTHIIDRIAQLLTPFRIDPNTEQKTIRYFTSMESDKYADRFLLQRDMIGRALIGINISAGSKTRFWGEDNFRKLCSHIIHKYPKYTTVILYQPSDEHSARRIAETNEAIVLSPRTSSFDQFAAIMKRLSIVITPDTSAVHIASAFGIGAVVLYVQSNKDLSIWEPYGTTYESVLTEKDDLSTIPFAQVQAALDRLVERS